MASLANSVHFLNNQKNHKGCNEISINLVPYKLNHKFTKKEERDNRDYIYDAINYTINNNQPETTIPSNILRSFYINSTNIPDIQVTSGISVLDQGNLGSCTANSLAVAVSIASAKKVMDLCRIYQYFNSKILDNSNPLSDTGATSQSTINALKLYSACSEKLFPYITTNYSKPLPIICYKNTYNIINVVYSYILQDVNMKLNLYNCLLNTVNKRIYSGIIVGFLVYSSFNNIKSDGIVPMPNTKTEELLGGHCVAIVGLKNIVVNGIKNLYIVFQNSWGSSWGDKGYGYFPIDYLQNSSLSEKMMIIRFNI